MPSLSFYERQHVQRLLKQQSDIARIFNQFCIAISPNLKKWTDIGNNNVWVRNSAVEKSIEIELLHLQSRLHENIKSNQSDSWEQSNQKNDDLIDMYIQGMEINQTIKQGMFNRNVEALSTLQNRVTNGMNLNDRIWNITDQTKTQLEFYLESGLSAGRPADLISQDVRQLLNEPDRRFHRIRNEKGVLVPSQPMKDYHPGPGQYRSSKQNALRLASTETNIAYRKSDSDRWKGLDFILGIDIRRSQSAKEPCKICDPLEGEYPKGFVFTGWHPFCICVATPKMMSPEEFANYLLTGRLPENKIIRDIPLGAIDFMKNNEYMRQSYAYRDNKDWFEGRVDVNTKQEVIKSSFKSAESIEEAQFIASKYVKKNPLDRTFKGEVNYSGLSLENANEVNRALSDVFDNFNLTNISGIKVVSPTSAQGKKAFSSGVDAIASYNPIEGGIFLNKDILKNAKTLSDYMKRSDDAWDKVMANIDKLSSAQKEIALKYKEAGRSLVGNSLSDYIKHELGHHVQWKVLPADLNNELGYRMNEYAKKISGYATSSKSEYLAESFAAFMKGEYDKIDPILLEFLNKKRV